MKGVIDFHIPGGPDVSPMRLDLEAAIDPEPFGCLQQKVAVVRVPDLDLIPLTGFPAGQDEIKPRIAPVVTASNHAAVLGIVRPVETNVVRLGQERSTGGDRQQRRVNEGTNLLQSLPQGRPAVQLASGRDASGGKADDQCDHQEGRGQSARPWSLDALDPPIDVEKELHEFGLVRSYFNGHRWALC